MFKYLYRRLKIFLAKQRAGWAVFKHVKDSAGVYTLIMKDDSVIVLLAKAGFIIRSSRDGSVISFDESKIIKIYYED